MTKSSRASCLNPPDTAVIAIIKVVPEGSCWDVISDPKVKHFKLSLTPDS